MHKNIISLIILFIKMNLEFALETWYICFYISAFISKNNYLTKL